jgi:4-amino-4-deoxy-L-arabinose transferase-like glycosyltransferase
LIWLIGLFLLRLASLKPTFIDDDEAWFSASARALTHPSEFYLLTPDNKPPGTVWFYWITGGDPILARLALILLTTLTAYLVYRICLKIGRSSSIAKTSAGLFLCSSAFLPKLFAVTNEGLILILSTAMLSIWLLAIDRKKIPNLALCIASGLLGSMTMLIKQTSVVYLFPIIFALFTLGNSAENSQEFRKSTLTFLTSFFVPFAFFILILGPHDFFYWNFTYATNVLTQARRGSFSEFKELLISLLVFAIAAWPLLLSSWKSREKSAKADFLIIWFLSALSAALAGWGLFLHYFIPVVAPLCYASTLDAWARRRAVGFSTTLYALSACVLLIPNSTTVLGTDLFYYGRLAEKIQKLTQREDPIFVWGSNPIVLALSSRQSVPRFLTTRFAVGPYSSHELAGSVS